MKKTVLVCIVLFVTIFSIININHSTKDDSISLNLENIEALASEIDFVFCACTSSDICATYSDGYFVIGYPLYFITV
ncbi:MAG: hypothetical protein LBD45_03395 [Bacteroidales bacterium]|nr:hypothetical protein [Bacteroidales bacterium]